MRCSSTATSRPAAIAAVGRCRHQGHPRRPAARARTRSSRRARGLPRGQRRGDPPRYRRRPAPSRAALRLRVDAALAAAVAREVPVDPRRRARRRERRRGGPGHPVHRRGRRVRHRGRVPGERPRKDAVRVALFAKRARDAARHRPSSAFGPRPVHPGLLAVDEHGRWGMGGQFGGRYVPETLMGALAGPRGRLRRHPPRAGSGRSWTTCSRGSPAGPALCTGGPAASYRA